MNNECYLLCVTLTLEAFAFLDRRKKICVHLPFQVQSTVCLGEGGTPDPVGNGRRRDFVVLMLR